MVRNEVKNNRLAEDGEENLIRMQSNKYSDAYYIKRCSAVDNR
jgi:hypothetical protein